MAIATIEEAIAEVRKGRMIILVDAADRENEGDLCMAASMCTPEAIAFMAKYGRGLICMPMTEERLVERSAENGAYLLDGLRTLLKHPWVGDVRGKGLFAGIELVRDRSTKEAMPADKIKGVVDFARRNGVLVGRSGGGRHLGSTIVLSPPLVITRAEIDRIVAVLDKAIAEMGGLLGAS